MSDHALAFERSAGAAQNTHQPEEITQRLPGNQRRFSTIAARAATLAEILNESGSTGSARGREAGTRFSRWLEWAADGDADVFARRLAWDGLDAEAARNCLATTPMDTAPRSWSRVLLRIVDSAKRQAVLGVVSESEHDQPLPFEEVVLPAVSAGKAMLEERAAADGAVSRGIQRIEPAAFATLARHLTWELSVIAAPSLEAEFDAVRPAGCRLLFALVPSAETPASRVHYRRFVEGLLADGLVALFERRPALARLIATVVGNWVDAMAEFLARLATDLPLLEAAFAGDSVDADDTVVALLPGLSDRHHRGRSVIGVSFRSNRKVAYKPRPVALEAALSRLLDWCNRAGENADRFRVLGVVDSGDYGWVEWVETAPVADGAALDRYYERAGALLCVVHVLWGTDCHRENLIAAGEHPVLIDAEALLHHEAHPSMFGVDAPDATSVDRAFRDSVLRTGMLPRWDLMSEGGRAIDVSALGGEPDTLVEIDCWKLANTDHMHTRRELMPARHSSHCPAIGDQPADPGAHVDAIARGFAEMYRLLLCHRSELLAEGGELAVFRGLPARFVLRPTQTYHRMLIASLDANRMLEGVDRSLGFEVLCRAFVLAPSRPDAWPLLRAEHEALERFDVPYFHGNTSETTLHSGGFSLERFFDRASYARVRERVESLSEAALELELSLIRGSFQARRAMTGAVTLSSARPDDCAGDISPSELLGEAARIAEELAGAAHHATTGSVNWIGLARQGTGDRFNLQPLGGDLYSGAPGVALFLAAMDRVRPGNGFGSLARAALKPLEDALGAKNEALVARWAKTLGIGGCTGLGSVVYALVRAGLLLEDPALIAQAERAATWITPEAIASDRTLDVLGGAAGAILGLLALYGVNQDRQILLRACNAAEHLLDRRVHTASGHRVWKTVAAEPLTGFAHGAAGIACALARLYEVTGDPRLARAIGEAIEFERAVYLPALERPPALASGERIHPWYMLNWCHGATGIGLGRIGLERAAPAFDTRADIEAAVAAVEAWGLQQVDHACCGNAGRSELLLEASAHLDRPELAAIARRRARWMAERARQAGGYNLFPELGARVHSPCWFQGSAGIAYHFLRLARPDLPCVLLLE